MAAAETVKVVPVASMAATARAVVARAVAAEVYRAD